MKNHLFIGLGGQGGKSVAELKKIFVQREIDMKTLGKNGINWDFLYMDSSGDVLRERKNWNYFGKSLKLDPDSFLSLKDSNDSIDPKAMALKADVAPWIGDPAIVDGFLGTTQSIQGANQRRRFGRLLFERKASSIMSAVEAKTNKLTANGANQCAFHIFASLAGGTGSGGIVDMVTLLRAKYNNANVDDGFPIFLYLYVTSEDYEDAQVGCFHQNQYATLRDLNALACGRRKTTLLGSRPPRSLQL